MKNSLWMSGKTCFLGKQEVHSAWITLRNTGLDQLTSACSTLLNLAWLLKGYTSWQAAHLWLARRPSPRCSPLATLLCGIYLIRGSRWPEFLTGQRESSRNHLRMSRQQGRVEQERRRGAGLVMTHDKNCPFFLSLAEIPPSLLQNELHLLGFKSTQAAPSRGSSLLCCLHGYAEFQVSVCTHLVW